MVPMQQYRTWVEINTAAITKNIHNYRKLLPKKTKILSVVKANAYGHGRDICAKSAITAGADYLAVFTMDDALALRKQHAKIPILVFKQIDLFDVKTAREKSIDVTVSSVLILKEIIAQKSKKNLNIHLKVDTGLSRQGFLLNEIDTVVALLKEKSNISIVGLYTHFTGAESKKFNSYTKGQVEEFVTWRNALKDAGYTPILHASATSGALLSPALSFDMVRFGIGMYGLWPSSEVKSMSEADVRLSPALTWKTCVSDVKTIEPNTGIGYEATYMTKKRTIIAVLPIGYWDGLPRSASNNIDVLIRGTRCRLLGRVMMNMCVVDVTSLKRVLPGDEVVIIGKQGKNTVSADELALCAGTINYEIVTRINADIPRIAVF